MVEVWRDITGYEGRYQVSNLGRVRSLNYGRTGIIKVLALKRVGYGYFGVNLYDSPRHASTYYIHRLVADAFIANPKDLPQINHKDEDKGNNAVNNLEWCTQRENNRYGTRLQRCAESMEKPVVQLKAGTIVHVWKSGADAGKHGFIPTKIAQCCRGKQRTHLGYEWRYAT